MAAGGNSLVQSQYDVIKNHSSAQTASRHSRPHLLLLDSNLVLSLSPFSLIFSAESYIHTLVQVSTLKIVNDQVAFLGLSTQSSVQFRHSSVPPSSFGLS